MSEILFQKVLANYFSNSVYYCIIHWETRRLVRPIKIVPGHENTVVYAIIHPRWKQSFRQKVIAYQGFSYQSKYFKLTQYLQFSVRLPNYTFFLLHTAWQGLPDQPNKWKHIWIRCATLIHNKEFTCVYHLCTISM